VSIYSLEMLQWSELEEAVRSDAGDPNKGPRSRHRATDLGLRSFSQPAMVAREKGEAMEGMVYFFFSASQSWR
jgi:hypothetical protein